MTTPIGPSFVAFQVRDLAASTSFYREVFGFLKADRDPPGAGLFITSPITLALREPLQPLPESGPLGTGVVLWVACADADAHHDQVVERGGEVVVPLNDGPFGRFFAARDID